MEVSQKAREVWQRVQGEAVPYSLQQLPQMIAEEKQDAATYLYLSHRFGGKEGAMLRRMFEEEQTHVTCLRGIYRMVSGERCSLHTAPAEVDEPSIALRKCYGREMRCLAAYEALSGDKEYGPVFAQLAAEEREHCKNILHLIGKMDLK
ncbi:MAG: hypothetical protein E7435_00620 [Ruminococcaceae bacterium]|nr:hypothetical protein [Oscillospiraceae bacterium]